MKWHCGTLNLRPHLSAPLAKYQRGFWFIPSFPSYMYRELEIFFATPGLPKVWLMKNLDRPRAAINDAKRRFRPYEEIKDLVMENWLSITRQDSILMSLRRPQHCRPPLASQLSIIDDVKRGLKLVQIIRDYRIDGEFIRLLVEPRNRWGLPDDFRRMLGLPDESEGYRRDLLKVEKALAARGLKLLSPRATKNSVSL
jgi:hypothetical protein